jgi:hypothetical protein
MQPIRRPSRPAAVTHRLARLVGAIALVLLVSAVGPIASVYACRCIAATDQALANADVAFVGVVAEVDTVSIEDLNRFTFRVESVMKGIPGDSIIISSGSSEASCGMTFAVGERWTVYASVVDGRPMTDLCSGTVLLEAGVEVPVLADADGGPPLQLLAVVGVVLALAAVSAIAFTRRGSAA